MTKKHNYQTITLSDGTTLRVWPIDSNSNGTPRFVVHYLSMVDVSPFDFDMIKHPTCWRPYRAKWFGGGLVYTGSISTLAEIIEKSRIKYQGLNRQLIAKKGY